MLLLDESAMAANEELLEMQKEYRAYRQDMRVLERTYLEAIKDEEKCLDIVLQKLQLYIGDMLWRLLSNRLHPVH